MYDVDMYTYVYIKSGNKWMSRNDVG